MLMIILNEMMQFDHNEKTNHNTALHRTIYSWVNWIWVYNWRFMKQKKEKRNGNKLRANEWSIVIVTADSQRITEYMAWNRWFHIIDFKMWNLLPRKYWLHVTDYRGSIGYGIFNALE